MAAAKENRNPSSSPSSSPRTSGSDQISNSAVTGWERFLPGRPLRILVVEADQATRQIVCALLSKCGYQVTPAADSLTAWDILEHCHNKFDLILTESTTPPALPEMDLLGKIISHDTLKDIPVVMMSSQDSLDMVYKCLMRGAKDFLVKPLRKNELQNLWQHVWRKNRESTRTQSGSDVRSRKRKATAASDSQDVSSDELSVSGVVKTPIEHREGNAIEVELDKSSGGHETKQLFLKRQAERDEQKYETVEDNESSERLGKAIDFIGTMRTAHESDKTHFKVEVIKSSSSKPHQSVPLLDLTLRRANSAECAQGDIDGQKGVQQSNSSAFSKYVSSTVLSQQQQSIGGSASLPSDQSSAIPADPSIGTCSKASERTSGNGSCGSSTLHFPQAVHFQHVTTQKNSTLSMLASPQDQGSSYTVQEKSVSNFRSPSLNSSSAKNFPLHLRNSQTGTSVMQADASKSQSGPVLCSAGSENGECSPDEAQVHPRNSYINPEPAGVYQESNVSEGFKDNMPPYMMDSSGGSNFCEGYQMGKSVNQAPGQTWCSFTRREFQSADEGSVLDCSQPPHNGESVNCTDHRTDIYRNPFREAALNKFRQKRKIRCFDKKVRYQTRKKLAEQRPRVKGQFVRQSVYDAATSTVKPTV